ncbi:MULTISPECIES: hypothetical protein [unclassified Psychrobacter]|uniref:hypothetical protein n=2 Tax=Psychrobacter TaxID=497 RepID=UPI000ECDDAFE|nr:MULTISPECIES: hypothetical protein [unclassified Psychrobacter]MBE8608754.1 hypothetical protein [Pseudomonas lundensis]HCI77108.1 hypothetical protein [Psychrobacter sp.]
MTLLSTFKDRSSKLTVGGALALALAATGCQSSAESNIATPNQSNGHSSTPVVSDISQQTLKQQALRIQRALANKDFARITNDIHPTRGVRFSMYAYVRPETDKVFNREQFAQYLQQSKIRFTWGEKDGTGDLLVTPLPTYLDTWIDASKFNNASISINEFQHSGNMINNLKKIYPNSEVVEFYHKGSEEYAGMDWRIMRLVFEEYEGKRYLVAIVNEQWTT